MSNSPIAPEDKSWLQSSLDTGTPGHFAMLAFLVTIAFAVVIFRRHLGLRYRLALVPLALMPLVSGIMGCSYDYLAVAMSPASFAALAFSSSA